MKKFGESIVAMGRPWKLASNSEAATICEAKALNIGLIHCANAIKSKYSPHK